MKKLLAILLTAALVLALSACVNNSGGSADGGSGTGSGDVGAVQSAESTGDNAPSESSPASVSSTPTAKLTRDEAIAKALEKAGVKKADARDIEAELDRDPDGLFWEIDFEVGNREYDFDVNAETGEVFDNGARPIESEQKISKDDAIAKALAAAGLKKADVRELEAELDKEHGGTYWEVEFESGNTEYSYDIDSDTGKVLKAERERD